jgi:hypothetical protein
MKAFDLKNRRKSGQFVNDDTDLPFYTCYFFYGRAAAPYFSFPNINSVHLAAASLSSDSLYSSQMVYSWVHPHSNPAPKKIEIQIA